MKVNAAVLVMLGVFGLVVGTGGLVRVARHRPQPWYTWLRPGAAFVVSLGLFITALHVG